MHALHTTNATSNTCNFFGGFEPKEFTSGLISPRQKRSKSPTDSVGESAPRCFVWCVIDAAHITSIQAYSCAIGKTPETTVKQRVGERWRLKKYDAVFVWTREFWDAEHRPTSEYHPVNLPLVHIRILCQLVGSKLSESVVRTIPTIW